MNKLLIYFENKKFVQWVLNPDNELDIYWKKYIETNPDTKKDIELTRLIISQLQSKKEIIHATEAIDLLTDILKPLPVIKKQKIRRIFKSLLKYAAVGLLFFSLGIAVYYFHKRDKFQGISEELFLVQDENHSQLILGDGKNVPVTGKESTIEYRTDGKIIINRRDTVFSKRNSEKQELNQLVVPYGKTSHVKLPDGTNAYLNAGSRLIYTSFFKGNKREVYLIGEGFFEVAQDKKMPFILQTNDLNIEVLGTKLNLSAYPSDNFVETVLVEGEIKLNGKGIQSFKKDYVLEPEQLAVFNRSSAEIKISEVDVINYIAWHQGFLNFQSSHLSRIIKKLERYYNIRILFDDPMLGIRCITGKLVLTEEKERILNILAKTSSAELIKINETTYMLK